MNNQQIESCVQRTVQGDTRAFEELYMATNQRVYFICLHFLKNEQDAKDALQDTYLSAYKNIRQLSEPSKFSSWVEHIAVNVCKNYLKKKNPSPVEDDTLLEILAAEEELILPDKYIDDAEKRRVLLEIMQNTLSDLQYRTIILYYFGNFTAPEIAEMMDCTEGAVKNRLATARAKIKKAIEEYQKDKDDKLFVFAGVPLLAKVFDEESKTLTAPALNTAMLTGSAAAGTTVSASAGTTVKTGGTIMSKKILIGILAGVVAVGAGAAAIGIAVSNNDPGNSTIQTENSVVGTASQNESSISAESQTEASVEEKDESSINEDDPTAGANILDSGPAGDTSTYTFYDNGTLIVEGTGEVTKYFAMYHPEGIYPKTLIIKEGITGIKKRSFHNMQMKKTILPSSLKKVEERVFEDCNVMTELVIPEGVTELEKSAFSGCEKLTEVTIPDSVTVMGTSCFHTCKALKQVKLSNSITEIPDYCFDTCSSLTEIVIPEGVTEIGKAAFEMCQKLESVTLPKTLTAIRVNAFCYDGKITGLVIPSSVETIEERAFGMTEKERTITVEGKSERPNGFDYHWVASETTVIWKP